MITVAALLLIGRDAARDLGMGGRNAGAVVDVAGRSLPLTQDAVSQRLAALELQRHALRDAGSGDVIALSGGGDIKEDVSQVNSPLGLFCPTAGMSP